MKPSALIYGRGDREYLVTLGATCEYGGYKQVLRVRANHWAEAKRYVENLDPFRVWKDYPALLEECGGPPGVYSVVDRKTRATLFCTYAPTYDRILEPEPDYLAEAYC
jgi:hypothetical protein